ncbi:hypothetical protein FACS1894217_11700 [Clostridia bacterium]|nr:hypothetical protein FACS1894217_11700 [Clostridia bacterium]
MNGKQIQVTAYFIGDNSYYKRMDLADRLNFKVSRDKQNMINIDT